MNSMDPEIVAEYINAQLGLPLCECELEAPLRTSWTEVNPGRRFYGCANYGTPNGKCNFFVWVDPEFPERSKNVINFLLRKTERLERENRELRMKDKKMKYGKIFAWTIFALALSIPFLSAMLAK